MKKIILTLLMCLPFLAVSAQVKVNGKGIIGKWTTVDDETGKDRSVVDIYEKGGKIYGKIIKIYREPGEEQDPICEICPGDRKNTKVIGLVIIKNMKTKSDKLDGGKILDPENGKEYGCSMWLENENKLNVRGWLGFFFRTQTWKRFK